MKKDTAMGGRWEIGIRGGGVFVLERIGTNGGERVENREWRVEGRHGVQSEGRRELRTFVLNESIAEKWRGVKACIVAIWACNVAIIGGKTLI